MRRLVVIVEVFVAQRQAVDALGNQLGDLVFDAVGIAAVLKAGRKPPQQIDASIGLAQQQAAGVGGDRPTVKARHNLAPKMLPKRKARWATLCNYGAASSLWS